MKINRLGIISSLLLLILLIISQFFYYQLKKKKEYLSVEISRLLEVNENMNSSLDHLFNNFIHGNKYNCFKINPDLQLVNKINVANSFQMETKRVQRIIFYIPTGVCHTCFDAPFEEVKRFLHKNSKEVMIITDPKRLRETISYFHAFGNELNIYRLDGKIGLTLEDGVMPFFFIIDSEMTCKNFFILDTSSDLVTKYFRYIESFFAGVES